VLWATSGAAEGSTTLNAFDNALLAAGIGNYNLVRVSSIVPPRARLLPSLPAIGHGSLVPCVYSVAAGETPGESLCAALGFGISRDDHHGMIFEHHGSDPAETESTVRQMVHEGFARRGLPLEEVMVYTSQHRVISNGCAIAAVVLWWGDES
jgi:arginine decarboxylase